MKKSMNIFLLSTIFLLSIVSMSMATPTNVMFGSAVTLHGNFFTDGSWTGADPAAKETLVDGVFLAKGHQWNQDTVFWNADDAGTSGPQFITFDLGGIFNIGSFIAQVDDNDAYLLSYWDLGSQSWATAWNIPNYDYYDNNNMWGMTTRPDPDNNTMAFDIGYIITTNKLKLEGDTGDGFYAVSEVQAFGEPVPEPSTLILLGIGLFMGLGWSKKRKRG
jgi:hypothetical protein